MRFCDFICGEAIRPYLQADKEYDAIQELIEALADAGEVDKQERDALVTAIESRERLGTTALGHDAALPHAKHPAARRCVGAVGISRHGIDFHGIDREKVHIVFLVVSPPDRAAEHVQALAHIASHLRDELFRRFLLDVIVNSFTLLAAHRCNSVIAIRRSDSANCGTTCRAGTPQDS